MLFYVECDLGCTLVVAQNADSARRKVQREVGTLNDVTKVSPAEDRQIAWVYSMGGHLPECRETTNWKRRNGIQTT